MQELLRHSQFACSLSCSCRLSLSYKLTFVPGHNQTTVISHDLTHTHTHKHSKSVRVCLISVKPGRSGATRVTLLHTLFVEPPGRPLLTSLATLVQGFAIIDKWTDMPHGLKLSYLSVLSLLALMKGNQSGILRPLTFFGRPPLDLQRPCRNLSHAAKYCWIRPDYIRKARAHWITAMVKSYLTPWTSPR